MQQNENPWTPGQIRLLGVILVLVITCFLEITVKEVSAQEVPTTSIMGTSPIHLCRRRHILKHRDLDGS